jgi:hypothetical protein
LKRHPVKGLTGTSNDEEYEVPCPSCGAENFIVFGKYGFFSTTDSMYMEPSTTARQVPLRPMGLMTLWPPTVTSRTDRDRPGNNEASGIRPGRVASSRRAVGKKQVADAVTVDECRGIGVAAVEVRRTQGLFAAVVAGRAQEVGLD